jgi:hypothetical protein
VPVAVMCRCLIWILPYHRTNIASDSWSTMKNKATNKNDDSKLTDLKTFTEGIIEQKQLENSALKKILEFLKKESDQIKKGDKNNSPNQIN